MDALTVAEALGDALDDAATVTLLFQSGEVLTGVLFEPPVSAAWSAPGFFVVEQEVGPALVRHADDVIDVAFEV